MTKKALLSLFVYLLFLLSLKGQNLVPNPGFETYFTCPSGNNQLNRTTSWYSPNLLGPDYFNQCAAGVSGISVPSNLRGFQHAKTGVAYVGIAAYESAGAASSREYIAVKLNAPLVPGQFYCISYYISLANNVKYGIDAIDVHFSQDSIYSANTFLPYQPQVTNQTTVMDTANWKMLCGTYKAKGGEIFLAIGNFKTYTALKIDSLGAGEPMAYYYIDDVSVVPVSVNVPANAGPDQIICRGTSKQIGSLAQVGVTYNWQPSAGLNNANIAQPLATPVLTTTYILSVSDPAITGVCKTTTDSITIFVKQTPAANAGDNKILCLGSSIQIGTTAKQGYIYSWSPATGLNNTISAQPVASPLQNITYFLSVTDTSLKTTCQGDKDSVLVNVVDCDTVNLLEIPNVFTPNGDGINDEFQIKAIGISQLTCTIFNRWGNKVHNLTVQITGTIVTIWDGRTSGALNVIEGVYYYKVKAQATNGKEFEENGFIQVIR